MQEQESHRSVTGDAAPARHKWLAALIGFGVGIAAVDDRPEPAGFGFCPPVPIATVLNADDLGGPAKLGAVP